MTRRKRITILAVSALLVAAVGYVAFEWRKAAQEHRERDQVPQRHSRLLSLFSKAIFELAGSSSV